MEVSQAKHRAKLEDAEQELGSESKKPQDWRERKAQRQKYWSVSQGFRFGRKLAEWGEDAPARPRLAHVAGNDGVEDADVSDQHQRQLRCEKGMSCRFWHVTIECAACCRQAGRLTR